MVNPDRDDAIYMGTGSTPEYLALRFANRHGLVTGATGTGKTVTLQVLAEGLSRAGVSVFAAGRSGSSRRTANKERAMKIRAAMLRMSAGSKRERNPVGVRGAVSSSSQGRSMRIGASLGEPARPNQSE